MPIPVANLYYLLAYAWQKKPDSEAARLFAERCGTPLELLASMLAVGIARLLKKGLDRDYRPEIAEIGAIKGRFLVAESIRLVALKRGRAVCAFDEFDRDALHNRLIKSTIGRLVSGGFLDCVSLRSELRVLHERLAGVTEIKVQKALFRQVRLNRNNFEYGFLLAVCELLHDNLLPYGREGQRRMRDFLRDEKQMPALFEAFVRNFYAHELGKTGWKVRPETLKWQFQPADCPLLPELRTDATLRKGARAVVIETKFYKEILASHLGGQPKLRRSHLSQLFSYLQSPNFDLGNGQKAEGILLYAGTGERVEADLIDPTGHKILVRTVDLQADWRKIRDFLLQIVENSKPAI